MFLSLNLFSAAPTAPILPSDNIQDPGDVSTPWGGCGPQDNNCYIELTSFTNENVTGLDYSTSTGILSLTSGYIIPTTASTTAWDNAIGALGGSALLQGGNSFGNTLTLGTNDNNTLSLETNNIQRLTIDTSGNTNITGTLTSLNITGTNTGDQTITLTGALTGTGTTTFSTSLGSFTKSELNTALSDGAALFTGDNISELINDSGYLTSISGLNISELNNDSNFISGISTFSTDDLVQGATNLYSQWVTSGSNVYYNGGNVGIGTSTPGSILTLGSGQISVPLGSLSNPSYSFNGDLNTGIFSGSADNLQFTVGGTTRMQFTPAGNVFLDTATQVRIPSGSVATPGLSFGAAASDAGIYRLSGSTLGISTAGTSRMFFDATGNVGIGTTTPSANLDVWGNFQVGTSSTPTISVNPATGNVSIGRTSNTNSTFEVYSTAISKGLRIDGAGNGSYLWFAGGNQPLSTINKAGIVVANGSFNRGNMYFLVDSSSDGNNANINDDTKMMIDYLTGNVGIGTTTPATMLSINSGQIGVPLGSAAVPSYSFNGDLNTGMYSSSADQIQFSTGGTLRMSIFNGAIESVAQVRALGTTATTPAFVGANDTNTGMFVPGSDILAFATGGTERIRIDVSGNVGIGTTTPADKLQVFGDIRVGTTGTNGCIKDFGGTGITGTCSSDERLKTNVIDLSDGYLEKLLNLKVITYNWNDQANTINKVDTTVTNYGLLAQNVESIFPELVTTDSNGYKQVNYSRLPLYLLKSVQELSKKVIGFAEEFKTKKLCVGDTCIDENQLKVLLQNQNIQTIIVPTIPPPTPTPDPIPTPDPVVEEVIEPGPVVETPEPVTEIPVE